MKAEFAIKEVIKNLPELPGIYKYFDKNGELIYVGKAKNLKKRVASYFTSNSGHNRKTQRLVISIDKIEYTVVSTEYDAYLLENNLIKENQPKYNIMLKDGKSYPFLCVTAERFPRVISTRNKKIKGEYFGPYTNVKMMNMVQEFLKEMFQIRNCTLNLSEENIKSGKYKVCLEYHLKKCKAPCVGFQKESDYLKAITEIKNILNGKLSPIKNTLKDEMLQFAENFEFEKAHEAKMRLDSLERYQSKSTIVSDLNSDLEVYTIRSDEKTAVVNFMKLINGTVIQTKTIEIQKKLEEPDSEILTAVIVNFRNENSNNLSEILTNVPIELEIPNVNFSIPQIGSKKKLIEVSLKNCTTALVAKQEMRVNRKVPVSLLELKDILKLKDLPIHIECFDNSNFQGSEPVSAMVCFKYGKPSNKDYRHYNIKTVEGPNDFDSMKEVVTRRYKRLLEENEPLPQLIVIDGGKGQLSAATEALKAINVYGKIAVIGIAKRLEEIYTPNDELPLFIDKKSPALILIQHLRNEAHRFGITHHRKKRTKKEMKLSVSDIKGIGDKTIEKILKHFKSFENARKNPDELEFLVGKSLATKFLEG